ncbi:hypothetical protein M2168_003655 [Streptomyces sp. CZ24]|nr:hypothetical protein [Streptomyces sp. CZ24]
MLCDFFTAIGRRLGKPVLMCGEGGAGHPVLGFDVGRDRVELLAEPLVTAEEETRGRAWRPGRPPAQSG